MQFEVTRLRRALMPLSLACVTLLSACGGSDDDDDAPAKPPVVTEPTPSPQAPVITGAWSAGDLHVHTIQSDDAQTTLETVLDQAFNRYKLDWAALSNHLRMSKRDHTGLDIPGGPVPFSTGMARYEAPFIQQAQAAGRYAGKIIFSSFEWDMPTHDHVNIGIGVNEPMSAKSLRAVAEFEYLYTNKAANLFDPQLVADLAGQPRAYSTHADSLAALKWLRDKHPDSYMLLNHPSRYAGKYTIGQLREMHDLAPSIFFAIEGMVGNQMEPDRGGYAEAYTPAKLPNRTYGGVDYLVAQLGGTWDALLGEDAASGPWPIRISTSASTPPASTAAATPRRVRPHLRLEGRQGHGGGGRGPEERPHVRRVRRPDRRAGIPGARRLGHGADGRRADRGQGRAGGSDHPLPQPRQQPLRVPDRKRQPHLRQAHRASRGPYRGRRRSPRRARHAGV